MTNNNQLVIGHSAVKLNPLCLLVDPKLFRLKLGVVNVDNRDHNLMIT